MDKMNKINKGFKNSLPMLLVILDGWGITGSSKGNAITLAKTPVIDKISKEYPCTEIYAHGKYVGLPPKQDGNSEAGHMNIGAGRVVEQDVVKICKSINDGTFFKNPAFLEGIHHVKKNNSNLHLMGMLSNGMSAHSDPDHILALLTLARKTNVKNVYLHLFTDGRDSPKYASLKLVEDLQKMFKNGEAIATIIGRFYAMDRKKRWDRSEKTYNVLVGGIGRKAKSVQTAITEAYNRGENDEFIEPYIISKNGKPTPRINNNDSVIFFNLRSDRARQLAKVFVQENFCEKNKYCFSRRKVLKNVRFIAMTDFGPDLDNMMTAYPGVDLKETLPMQLRSLKQLYLAETEKYAHVTYFMNGGYADPVDDEIREVVPSPDVRSYDKTPAMSSEILTKKIISYLKNKKFDFVLANYAAPDMIGHTGNLQAGIECCQKVDQYLGELIKAYLSVDGTIIVTADHGNIEEMINLETGEIDTEHSVNKVPFIVVNDKLKRKISLKNSGSLCDVTPTVLHLLGLTKPKTMSGDSLIK